MDTIERTYLGGANFRLRLIEQCLWIDGCGHWNERIAIDYKLAFQQLIKDAELTHWHLVLDVRQWDVSTPEAKPHFEENTVWCLKNGMKNLYVLVGDNERGAWNLQTQSNPSQVIIPVNYFIEESTLFEQLASDNVLNLQQDLELYK